MPLNLIASHFSDITWILFALGFGLIATSFALPPMIGYLFAGFLLSSIGIHSGNTLTAVADIGVTLLLFSIGLKLNLRDLLRTEIWASSILHMVITIVLAGSLIFFISFTGLQQFSGLSLTDTALIAFALSFSSTVFAVKVLDEKSEMSSLHGKIAIGILIMQDLFAVLFLTFSSGKIPEFTAILLLAFIPLRPLLIQLLHRAGHGELLILSGMVLALGGASIFGAVGLKPDLGALLFGVLLAGNEKSEELAKSLLAFKELFLVAFFLSIGFNGLPSASAVLIAAALSIFMLVKSFLFFRLLTAFKLRARTSFLASLSLSNYSEFGLIVGSIGVANNWIDSEWLLIIALALSLTFILSSLASRHAHEYYARFEKYLCTFERDQRLPDDKPIESGDAKILVFGMGRVGTGVYDTLLQKCGNKMLGIDYDPIIVRMHVSAGRNVILGDATDFDFWERLKPGRVKLIMLDMPNIHETLAAVKMIKATDQQVSIAASVKHDDNMPVLKQAGVSAVFNIYAEAGAGFANHVFENANLAGQGNAE